MKFTKMHGCGNDYVYVNCFAEQVDDPGAVAKLVSDRHFGIGSDGLILIRPSKVADFEMAMYNADGSRGEMCGNGIRCVAKYVYDFGLTDKTSISVETLAGIKYLELTVKDGKVALVRVNMGAPILEAAQIPCDFSMSPVVDQPLAAADQTWPVTCVSMGNPHCVVFTDTDVRELDLAKIGPEFEHHSRFPKRINTEFVNVIDDTHLRMRVWERGSGETLACGTGTCATVVAAVLNGLTKDEVSVELLGGELFVQWDRKANLVYMTGPATTVFSGEIEIKGEK
jgi:diaminopimelate epimerase